MDSIVHAALEEICSQGVNGITLPDLWPKLHSPLSAGGLHLCPSVKKALWANLISIPALEFESQGVSYSPRDEIIQSFEVSEKLNLKIVAVEHLRNSFVGIYDIKASDAGISQPQRRALERLAIARTNGITQSELAKEFGMKGNNIFYVLRNLECRGLIVRQSTLVRTKGTCSDGEPKTSSVVSTNMLHLYRYGKHLGSQQRFEITKEEKNLAGNENDNGNAVSGGGGGAKENVQEHMRVKDHLPALKAICDKLDKADGKVLVVSDIKRDLGYRGSSGHKAWRNICHRLKDARVVEEFCAKVNKKEVSCLRLLKSFSPTSFEPKALRRNHDVLDSEQSLKSVKRGQITDQLVELPIEHQIYDMIDAEGSKGLTIPEICKRLGIANKRYYTRLLNMFTRFGMHLEGESHNRGVAYRVWTSGNFNPEASSSVPSKPDNLFSEDDTCNPHSQNLDCQENPPQTVQEVVHLTTKGDTRTSKDDKNISTESEVSHAWPVDGESNYMVLDLSSTRNVAPGPSVVASAPEPSDQEVVHSTSKRDTRASKVDRNMSTESEVSHALLVDGENNNMPLDPSSTQNAAHEPSVVASDAEHQIVNKSVSDVAPFETPPPGLVKPRRRRSYQRYPCLNLSALGTQREQRILELLQEEKFIIKAELHRHLENLEDRQTMMDRKTLVRTLNKLQQEGRCKCISVSVPVVTNCGRTRTTEVVLHPSVFNVSTELLGQIHERLRSFEIKVRAQAYPRLKKAHQVPVLNGVQRVLKNENLDGQAEKMEAMRANGFILAKMVRTKLLHIFIWGYVSGLPSSNDALSSGNDGNELKNPHSTCKLFELDAAIKAMPLELFLQVAGSTNNFNDMIEKCRQGLCLSDLHVEERKRLMDTQATGRLSSLINILRRLKLIRMVSGGHSEDASHATLAHALELKPYIEEPVAVIVSPTCFISLDLRPQIRHDFVLSSKKAVDDYWNTLEYSYAASDSKAALHAFPGSAVHEVFLYRSWASVRVMTADQRAKLLKRVVTDDPNIKLSYKECEKIAKDLNLTLEQVLRVYYDKRQQRLSGLQGVLKAKRPPRKRKRSSEGRSSKHVKVDTLGEPSVDQRLSKSVDNEEYAEEPNLLSSSKGDHDVDDHGEAVAELGSGEEDEDDDSFIHKCALSTLKGARRRKFSWTEKADRQLVIEYVRRRAVLGANFHRIDWSSISNLPAPPATCRRRMALLKSSIPFRKLLMNLCNMLSARYAKCLANLQNKPLNNDSCRVMARASSSWEDCNRNLHDSLEHAEEFDLEERWDNFDDESIKMALDEVIRFKRFAKDSHPNSTGISTNSSKEVQHSGIRSKVSARRSSFNRIPRKYIKLLNEGLGVSRRAHESLAVSNAVELFKLVFLSTSTAPEVPNLLAETLRRYSEHDLFAAFNYLRENNIMVGGSGNSPFVLSQQFLQTLSSSPFPTNTGKRATKLAGWLHEKEEDLMEEGIDLSADLQCGDVLHLCALISSGEILISPCLPDEGVGEAEEMKSLKRKADGHESDSAKGKKLKHSVAGEGEVISRREKGFPGIRLSLSRATISRLDIMEMFKDGNSRSVAFPLGENDQGTSIGQDVASCSSYSDHSRALPSSGSTNSTYLAASLPTWNAMTSYAEHLMSLSSKKEKKSPVNPDLFRTVYSAIQKAGDQGLSMEEISKVTNIPGEEGVELVIEVLEAFGQALKVNAFDSVHVVDALYRSKYSLTTSSHFHQEQKETPLTNTNEIIGKEQVPVNDRDDVANSDKETSMNADEVHRVTILNLPKEVVQPSSETQSMNEMEGQIRANVISPGRDGEGENFNFDCGNSHLRRPILPWINGDGTTNEIVYKGLVRRLLGIVMQNPGILEDDIISQMEVLNPQSCRDLLRLMILDKNIFVRKMQEATTSGEPPPILASILGTRFKKSKLVCRDHFFANPTCTMLL